VSVVYVFWEGEYERDREEKRVLCMQPKGDGALTEMNLENQKLTYNHSALCSFTTEAFVLGLQNTIIISCTCKWIFQQNPRRKEDTKISCT